MKSVFFFSWRAIFKSFIILLFAATTAFNPAIVVSFSASCFLSSSMISSWFEFVGDGEDGSDDKEVLGSVEVVGGVVDEVEGSRTVGVGLGVTTLAFNIDSAARNRA